MPITIEDLNDLVRLLDEHPDWQEALARRLFNERILQRLLQAEPGLHEFLRRLILDEEFLQLPAIVRELVEVSRQSIERITRLEERVEQFEHRVEERFEHVEERFERVEERVDRLEQRMEERFNQVEERLMRVEEGVDDWKQWRQGEDGRREGERYERKILRQAFRLLSGGEGGSPDDELVRRRLASWLAQIKDDTLEDESDPSLADILWWKGERVAVVEVSLKVDRLDVLRAKWRAETLRQIGVDAMPLVIGEQWAHPETRALAQQEGVEWLVNKEFSPGLIEFRQLLSD
ncbi:MAG: hypothetical protein ACK4P5_00015 [Fimbriimonadales bacterium]